MNRLIETGIVVAPTVAATIAGYEAANIHEVPNLHMPFGAIAEAHLHGLMEGMRVFGTVGGAAIGFAMGISSVYFMRQAERQQQ